MQFKVLQGLTLASMFAAGAIADGQNINTQLQALQQQLASYREAINKYDGGYRSMLPVAVHTLRVNSGTAEAKKAIQESARIVEENADNVLEEGAKTLDAIADTLDAVASKENVTDSNGFRHLWAFAIRYWSDEYQELWDAFEDKVQQENSENRVMSASAGMVDQFRTVQDKFR